MRRSVLAVEIRIATGVPEDGRRYQCQLIHDPIVAEGAERYRSWSKVLLDVASLAGPVFQTCSESLDSHGGPPRQSKQIAVQALVGWSYKAKGTWV